MEPKEKLYLKESIPLAQSKPTLVRLYVYVIRALYKAVHFYGTDSISNIFWWMQFPRFDEWRINPLSPIPDEVGAFPAQPVLQLNLYLLHFNKQSYCLVV